MDVHKKRRNENASMGKKNPKEHFWREEDQTEIYELFNEATIDEVVRSRRLQWLEDMERMDDSKTVKGIEGRGTEGKRKLGRPWKEQRETVWEDIRQRNNTNWKEKAKDKKMEGRNQTIRYQAMGLNGLWRKPY